MAKRRIRGRGVESIAAAGKISVPAIDIADRRAGFSVSNLSAVGAGTPVYIRSSNGNAALAVFDNSVQGFETDDAFEVYNPNGGAVNVIIGEIYLAGITSAPAVASGGGGSGGSGPTAAGPAGGGDYTPPGKHPY